uniref:Uncharacterized protein n=1 Tax=Arundo donax TaxID=35708 RepID=A0A0A9G8T3_ARUDO
MCICSDCYIGLHFQGP